MPLDLIQRADSEAFKYYQKFFQQVYINNRALSN